MPEIIDLTTASHNRSNKGRAFSITHYPEGLNSETTPSDYMLEIPGVKEMKQTFGVVAGLETCPSTGRLHMQGESKDNPIDVCTPSPRYLSPVKKLRRRVSVTPITIPSYTFDPIRKALFTPSPKACTPRKLSFDSPCSMTTICVDNREVLYDAVGGYLYVPETPPPHSQDEYMLFSPELCERCDRYICNCSVQSN